MFKKILNFFFIIALFYQSTSYSKSTSLENFNSKDLSNYFSGIVAFENKKNELAPFFGMLVLMKLETISSTLARSRLIVISSASARCFRVAVAVLRASRGSRHACTIIACTTISRYYIDRSSLSSIGVTRSDGYFTSV